MQKLKRTLALLFIIFGGFGLMAALATLINPIGSSAADREGLFGPSLASFGNLLLIAFYAVLLVSGIWITVSDHNRRDDR